MIAFYALQPKVAGGLYLCVVDPDTQRGALEVGNAIERMVARQIRNSPELSAVFQHVGGPNQPDFVGVGVANGETFDITTTKAIAAHGRRPYGAGLQFATYNRPGTFTVFP